MGSLLRNQVVVKCFLLTLLTVCASLNAATENVATKNHKPVELLLDGYYPPYPAVNVATGDKAKLIERGEYLAKMGDCIACHTNVKGKTSSFAGGLPLVTPFGTFYSPNITPDKETGIGNWTEADFIRAMKEGRDPQGRNYFPVFPYLYFSNMTDNDAKALYTYFMNIPAVNLKNKPLPFPFGVPGARFSLWGWNLLFFYPNQKLQYDTAQSPQWNRGKYIVDGLGHCSMCHTPLNVFGAPKSKHYLTGTFIDGFWAPNITKFGLDSANHSEVVDVFAQGKLINRAGPVAGPMAEVNHNSLNYLNADDQLAIATYLKTVVSNEPFAITPSKDTQPGLKRGKQVYIRACITCHQNGEMTAPRIGNGSNWFMRLKQRGLTGLYRHTINGYNSMPVKGACVTCSDNDLISAVDYILNKSLSRSQLIDLESGGAQKYPSSGKEIYNENCSVCHNEGKLGAPKIGDKEAWKPLIAKNIDVLIEETTNGKGHPKNGGCTHCTTAEVIDAIKYIVGQSKTEGNFSLW